MNENYVATVWRLGQGPRVVYQGVDTLPRLLPAVYRHDSFEFILWTPGEGFFRPLIPLLVSQLRATSDHRKFSTVIFYQR